MIIASGSPMAASCFWRLLYALCWCMVSFSFWVNLIRSGVVIRWVPLLRAVLRHVGSFLVGFIIVVWFIIVMGAVVVFILRDVGICHP